MLQRANGDAEPAGVGLNLSKANFFWWGEVGVGWGVAGCVVLWESAKSPREIPKCYEQSGIVGGFWCELGGLCSGWVTAGAAERPHEYEQRAASPGTPSPPERLIWLLTRCTHNISLKKLLKCHLGLLEGQFLQFTL